MHIYVNMGVVSSIHANQLYCSWLCVHSLVTNSATLWFSRCLRGVEELSSDPCISVAI